MSKRAASPRALRKVQFEVNRSAASIWSALCRHLADKFESIGEDEGVAFSGRCGLRNHLLVDKQRLGGCSLQAVAFFAIGWRFPRASFCQAKGLEIVTLPICRPF
jgi:hypothetical protein